MSTNTNKQLLNEALLSNYNELVKKTNLSIKDLRIIRKHVDELFKIKIKQKVEEKRKKRWKQKKIARPVFYISDSSGEEE